MKSSALTPVSPACYTPADVETVDSDEYSRDPGLCDGSQGVSIAVKSVRGGASGDVPGWWTALGVSARYSW